MGTLNVRFPDVGCGREVAREVIRLFGYTSAGDYRADVEAFPYVQETILHVQKAREGLAMKRPVPLWVWDRSILDPVAYAAGYGVDGELVWRWRREAVWHAATNYPLIIYCPPGEVPLEDDGFRSTDAVLRTEVDRYLRELLDAVATLGGVVHRLVASALDDRVDEVVAVLKTAGLWPES